MTKFWIILLFLVLAIVLLITNIRTLKESKKAKEYKFVTSYPFKRWSLIMAIFLVVWLTYKLTRHIISD